MVPVQVKGRVSDRGPSVKFLTPELIKERPALADDWGDLQYTWEYLRGLGLPEQLLAVRVPLRPNGSFWDFEYTEGLPRRLVSALRYPDRV